MTRRELLDLYFLDARSKLIDIAAFLDRVDRGEGAGDFRLEAFRSALEKLPATPSDRARIILEHFSDPGSEPAVVTSGKSACGAWQS
jgi:hypothetical protein